MRISANDQRMEWHKAHSTDNNSLDDRLAIFLRSLACNGGMDRAGHTPQQTGEPRPRVLRRMSMDPRRKIVICVHGINTHGEWEMDLAPLISEQGWIYYPLHYGNFALWRFLIPGQRRKQIEWFRDKYNLSHYFYCIKTAAKNNCRAIPHLAVLLYSPIKTLAVLLH